jgi:DNA-binding protein YbaB
MVFGNLGKMAEMMKQAKRVKDLMSKVRCEGEAGGVKIVVNGEMDFVEVNIPVDMSGNKAASLVKEAANKAMHLAKIEAAKAMQAVTGGMQLPGM